MNFTPQSAFPYIFSHAIVTAGCLVLLAGCGGTGSTEISPAPTIGSLTLTTSATTVTNGSTATLTWTGSAVSNCVASGEWTGSRSNSGSEDVGPLTADASFSLDCDSSTGSLSRSVTITIGTVTPPTDPQLVYATYFGGVFNETIRDVAVGPDGSVYLAGGTESSDFPVQNGYDTTYNGTHDVTVAKFTPGGILVWATFIGGTNYDRAYAIEVDDNGDVYIAGRAGAGYPTTAGVAQTTFGGDTVPNGLYGQQDGFITKMSTTGQMIWSTYIGGDDRGYIRDIDIDASGNVYFALTQVSTSNASVAHLITANSFQTTFAGGLDGIIGKLRNDGAVVQWGTYLGGSNDDTFTPAIRVDLQGNVLVAGHSNSLDMPVNAGFGATASGLYDMHLTKFLPDGSDIVYAAYIGGSAGDTGETHHLAVDSSGNAYVAAGTSSSDFPVTSGAFQTLIAGGADAFVTKVSPQGNLLSSSYFGGSGNDHVEGISIAANGDVVISGVTYSTDLAISSDAAQSQFGGASDMFVARLNSDLSSLVYSTYVGGSTYDQARSSWVDGDVFYVVGHSNSSNFPVTNNAFDRTLNGNPNTGNKFSGDGILVYIEFAQP